ncbi:MAG: TIGR00730 family Rossman fold protein [Pseudomonadota bacterium]
MKFICVFCGTSERGALKYTALAQKIAETLVANGFGLVCGGANVGLMKVLTDHVLSAGGEVIGVLTPELQKLGVVHADIKTENLHVEQTYAARKSKMSQLSSGFIALPGGLGTVDELTEIAIYNQFASYKHYSDNPVKPCAVMNPDGFYDGFAMQLKRCLDEKFMTQQHLDLLLFTDDPVESVEHIVKFKGHTPDDARWWELT